MHKLKTWNTKRNEVRKNKVTIQRLNSSSTQAGYAA